jgi:hypothetical protein
MDSDIIHKVIEDSKVPGTTRRELQIRYGLSEYTVRKILDPLGHKISAKQRANRPGEYFKDPLYDPERDGITYHTDLSSLAFGDPLPGRSALDQKKNGKNWLMDVRIQK